MPFLLSIKRKAGNVKALMAYPDIIKKLRNKEIFFFFPFWHIGGAERVHLDILKEFQNYKSICFITGESINAALKNEFTKYADTVELRRWATKRAFKHFILRKIAFFINKQNAPIVFGCNSPFFYELIPFLKDSAKIIDLIHAFSDRGEGAEWYSLSCVKRLDKRVILGSKTKKDFEGLYREAVIPDEYLNRFVVIPNTVDVEGYPQKDFDGELKILFVGRNSHEKRVELFLRITELCFQEKLNARFIMIGPFDNLKHSILPNTDIIGELTEKEVLNHYYSTAHLIVITSYREGFPMVILEGMSHGTIPISTDVGEIPAYISAENQNGFLIKNEPDIENSAVNFTDRIRYLSQNRQVLAEYSHNAFEFVKKHFSHHSFSESYKDLFFRK